MALSILDGNQSATTLSTILSSGQHITAHTVVSLGTQAITDIRGAVSGSVVSISNFPTSQSTTFGAVTGSVSVLNFPASQAVTFTAISISNFPATQPVSIASVTVGNTVAIAGTVTANPTGTQIISGTVTVGNSITIGSLPAITGTVTAGFSRVTWTNYSGSVVTANTAVTAISTTTRSYLLAQVTTGQMFVNIGATATSVNSVYFSAGQGFAWETTVPQGIVSIISAVTGTNYVLKEG